MKNDGKYFTVVSEQGKYVKGSCPTSNPDIFVVFPPVVYPFKYCGYTFFAHRGYSQWTGEYYREWMVSELRSGRPVLTWVYERRKDAIEAAKNIIDFHASSLETVIAEKEIKPKPQKEGEENEISGIK